MDESGEPATPLLLLQFLHQQFPQFAEKDDKGWLKNIINFIIF